MIASILRGADDRFGHMDGWDGGWMWLWGTLMMAIIVLVTVWLVRAASRRQQPTPSASGTEQARAILAERYARGELTTEEYRERLGNLV